MHNEAELRKHGNSGNKFPEQMSPFQNQLARQAHNIKKQKLLFNYSKKERILFIYKRFLYFQNEIVLIQKI